MTLGIWILNKKAYDFIEINEWSGWNLAPLRE